jgi:hypothetical protein
LSDELSLEFAFFGVGHRACREFLVSCGFAVCKNGYMGSLLFYFLTGE